MTEPIIVPQEILETYGGKFPKKIYIKFKGKSDLVVKDWTPITPDALLLNLQVKNTDPNGVQPTWQIDKAAKKTQMLAIKDWLEAGHTITPLEALEMFGCFRLSAQIFNLKKLGLKIDCKTDKDPRTGKRYGTYWLLEGVKKSEADH